ncbi:MAG: hypothetical protein EZS28_037296 [Streblomastix strix]|uniref:Uncharacterized protein n=1 Tax=Streblomastix strix TaxID=222440 RepID=A0A5J4U9B5_9EUKA|nr:MAG: hypothetical protein EZS28_037296 [Streblomastix strix]
MEKSGEQDDIDAVAKSNLFQGERGISGVIEQIDKGSIESGDNQSDQLIESLTMEQNICKQEVGRRIEKINGLPTIEHTIEIPTFYNERSEQGIGEISGLYAQVDVLYESGNAFQNLDSTEDFRKDNLNNNRQSEKQEFSRNNQLHGRCSVLNVGSIFVEEKIGKYCGRVSQLWMGDKQVQEQAEPGIQICISGMDVSL